jgi:hypothetical protein
MRTTQIGFTLLVLLLTGLRSKWPRASVYSVGKEPGEQWSLDFGDGARASVVTGDSGLNRALCVRRLTGQ